jgi:hypothetical protein
MVEYRTRRWLMELFDDTFISPGLSDVRGARVVVLQSRFLRFGAGVCTDYESVSM